MKKKLLFLLLITGFLSNLSAQKVGLVLSGGGARGIAHIGIIQALEENHIPIDYITGTSMGAIVGGLYSIGMTPQDMVKIIKSEDFARWSTGELETEYIYYYRNADPKPKFVELPFKINKLDSIKVKPNILPTNLVSPRQMNFAFLPMFAGANAVCDGDFNKLFVPFRCVASDIYKKEAVVFSKGDLGDAVRASMTFPFVYKPIVVDGRLLFDGGIFNNFPVDVMKTDFSPDFMIGSVVSDNPPKPDEQDIVQQIENMIMSRTNYSMDRKDGVLLKFKLDNINTFDFFSNVDQLVRIGYDSTIAHMPEIRARVQRKITEDSVAHRRKEFKDHFPKINFKNVEVVGVDSLQKHYVERVFHSKEDTFNLKEFKKAYFMLISDDKISEVLPHAKFNKTTGLYDLKLNVKIQDQLKVLLGGNISSSTSNEAYFGLVYQNLNEYAQTATLDAQFGRMYNGLGFTSRMEIPTQRNWYVKLQVILHKFDYYKGNRLFYDDDRTAFFNQYEGYGKMSVGFPIGMKGRFECGLGYGALVDYYTPNLISSTSNNKSIFSLGSAFGRIETSTLNDIMYPTRGERLQASLQLLGGEEMFRPASGTGLLNSEKTDLWAYFKGKIDEYYPMSPNFSLGTLFELSLSTRKLLNNYAVTVIQAPIFQPTPHSKTVFNESFSANQYAVLGLKPIYNISKQLHVRNESYCFLPYKSFIQEPNFQAGYSKSFHSVQFMNETSLVFNFKIASASMFVNYYSSAASKWNFGVNIGFLLFNPKFTD